MLCSQQGSSASRMTAAKVMDVGARQPDCAGPASDAVSAHTQRVEGAPNLFESSKVRMSRFFGYVFHDTNGQNHGQTLKIQWFFLNGKLCGHLHAGLLWERQF